MWTCGSVSSLQTFLFKIVQDLLITGKMLVFVVVCSLGLSSKFLEVSAAPSVTTKGESLAVLGRDTTITCAASGYEPGGLVKLIKTPKTGGAAVTMMTNNQLEYAGPDIGRFSVNHIQRGEDIIEVEFVLNIANVQQSDEGSYTCELIVTGDTVAQDSLDLTVRDGTQLPPKVMCDGMDRMTGVYLRNVNVSCEVEGEVTSAQVYWYRMSAKGMTDPKFKISCGVGQRVDSYMTTMEALEANKYRMTLHINRVYPQDFRSYYFIAGNEYGTNQDMIKLTRDPNQVVPGAATKPYCYLALILAAVLTKLLA